MRPKPFSLGNVRRQKNSVLLTHGFNEAQAFQPGKHQLQNGADTSTEYASMRPKPFSLGNRFILEGEL